MRLVLSKILTNDKIKDIPIRDVLKVYFVLLEELENEGISVIKIIQSK